MDLAKMNKILEKFWWLMAIITLVGVIYFSVSQGFDQWKLYYLVPIIAAGMALLRRFMSKKLDKSKLPKNK